MSVASDVDHWTLRQKNDEYGERMKRCNVARHTHPVKMRGSVWAQGGLQGKGSANSPRWPVSDGLEVLVAVHSQNYNGAMIPPAVLYRRSASERSRGNPWCPQAATPVSDDR